MALTTTRGNSDFGLRNSPVQAASTYKNTPEQQHNYYFCRSDTNPEQAEVRKGEETKEEICTWGRMGPRTPEEGTNVKKGNTRTEVPTLRNRASAAGQIEKVTSQIPGGSPPEDPLRDRRKEPPETPESVRDVRYASWSPLGPAPGKRRRRVSVWGMVWGWVIGCGEKGSSGCRSG